MDKGIDYGMGTTNIDRENGIRYGVISSHEVCQAWCDSSEADYGDPTCPRCGNNVVEWDSEKHDEDNDYIAPKYGCCDWACEGCERAYDSQDVYGEEPNGHNYEGDGYQAFEDSQGDIFILKSPYFTRAQFCSPCAPGACHLENPTEDGERAYCFGHDWFDNNLAPYPVYSVATGEQVFPE